MRVKVRSISGYVEVVNTETGELLEGVSRLSLHAAKDGTQHLTIVMDDYDVDVEMVADVMSREGLIPRGEA